MTTALNTTNRDSQLQTVIAYVAMNVPTFFPASRMQHIYVRRVLELANCFVDVCNARDAYPHALEAHVRYFALAFLPNLFAIKHSWSCGCDRTVQRAFSAAEAFVVAPHFAGADENIRSIAAGLFLSRIVVSARASRLIDQVAAQSFQDANACLSLLGK